jgi:hypothetical protein
MKKEENERKEKKKYIYIYIGTHTSPGRFARSIPSSSAHTAILSSSTAALYIGTGYVNAPFSRVRDVYTTCTVLVAARSSAQIQGGGDPAPAPDPRCLALPGALLRDLALPALALLVMALLVPLALAVLALLALAVLALLAFLALPLLRLPQPAVILRPSDAAALGLAALRFRGRCAGDAEWRLAARPPLVPSDSGRGSVRVAAARVVAGLRRVLRALARSVLARSVLALAPSALAPSVLRASRVAAVKRVREVSRLASNAPARVGDARLVRRVLSGMVAGEREREMGEQKKKKKEKKNGFFEEFEALFFFGFFFFL